MNEDENVHFGRRPGPLHWFDWIIFVLMLASVGVFCGAMLYLKGWFR